MLDFNEYAYREQIDGRIQVELKAKNDEILNPWEAIGNVNNNSSIFYKLDLIETVESLIAKGIDSSRIFIMEGNFSINDGFREILNENKFKAFSALHEYGSITTMTPNSDYTCISILYSFKKQSSTFTRRNGISGFSNAAFENEIKEHLSKAKPLKEILNILADMVIYQIEKFSGGEKKDRLLSTYKYIVSEFSEKIQRYRDFTRGSINKNIVKSIQKNKVFSSAETKLYSKFYKPFHVKLEKLERPIIGILDDSLSLEFKILNIDSIIYNSSNPNVFIDLNTLGHNSPWYEKYLIPGTVSLCFIIGAAGTAFANYTSGMKDIEETKKIVFERKTKEYEFCMNDLKELSFSKKAAMEKCRHLIEDYTVEASVIPKFKTK